ncbi:MAG: hypothetical protein ABSH25_09070 [Syntrophorhabdales bacterium]
MEGHEKEAGYFPELQLSELQRYAQRWARRYYGIERVCLYNYVHDHLAVHKGLDSNWDVRYVIVFELRPDINPRELTDLEMVTERHENIHVCYPVLFDHRFFSVYIDKPDNDYTKHWVIRLRKTGEQAPGPPRKRCLSRTDGEDNWRS